MAIAPKFMDIVTDLGEECDDEVACLLVYKRCAAEHTLFVRIFFTDPKGRGNFMELLDGKPMLPNLQLLAFTEDTFKSNENQTLLVQIAPINKKYGLFCTEYAKKPFDYILLGELGSTVNSKGDAEEVATMFITASTSGMCVETRGGEGAPKFSVGGLYPLGDEDSPIVEHVLKIGFRNSVGRASATGGAWIAHLVAADRVGANYQTCRAIAKSMKIVSDPNNWSDYITTPPVTFEDYRRRFIMTVVEKYLVKLKKNGLQEIKRGGETNNTHRVTFSQIREGYAFILDVLNQAFDVPIDFFSSQTADRKWHPQWEFNESSPAFEQEFSGQDDIHERMKTAYSEWKTTLTKKPSMETTPAYDIVAIVCAEDFLECQRDRNRTSLSRFDILGESSNFTRLILNADVKKRGLKALLE